VYEQNLSVMGVASCRSTFLCLMSRVRLVLFRISVRDWIPFNGRACRGFRPAKWLGPNPTQPSLVRPGPARPWRPHPPPMRPLLSSLSHLDFPSSNLPLPLPPLSPCGALGIGDGDHRNLDPEVSPPPLPFPSPLSPSPNPSLPCARPLSPPCARPRLGPRRGPCPRRAAPACGVPAPGATRVARLPPNAFSRAQTHARGDYFWL
jgi:hypothetical protein